MTPLYTYNGKLLVKDNKLATSSDCCCEPPSGCVCKTDQWRLMENDSRIDGDSIVNGGMVNAKPTWEPYWYLVTGNITYTLEVHCQDEWIEIDSWERSINLCEGPPARLCDALVFALPYNLGIEAPNCGDCPCLLGVNGVGPGEASVFLASVDKEWSNLLNWIDHNGISPARSYPTPASTIYIYAELLKNSFDSQPALTLINVGYVDGPGNGAGNVSGKVGISLTGPANFYFESELLEEGNCGRWPDTLTPYKGGYILGNCNFNQTTLLSGQVVGNVMMDEDSSITPPGEVYGSGIFNKNSKHHGYLEGVANFYNTSECIGGTVCGPVTMHNSSIFGVAAGSGAFVACDLALSPLVTCDYDLTLTDESLSFGATVCRDAIVTGATSIGGPNVPKLEGCGIARDLLINANRGVAKNCVVGRDLLMSGNQTLSHTSGFINVTGHVICTSGYFGESSQIQSGDGGAALNFPAQLTGFGISGPGFFWDATISTVFGDADLVNSINFGKITGDATFVNNVPLFLDANKGTVEGDATFQNCNNDGTVEGSAILNGNSVNRGTINGDAAFNDSSYNECLLGSVTGTATYNGLTGYVSPYYYILGQCTNLDASGNGFWNGHAYYLGALQPKGYNTYHYYINDVETTLNSEGNGYWNSQYYYLGNVFVPTLQIFTGSVNGDWNNLGNWKPDANLPLLAERLPLSTENVALWASVTTNGGSQPTVTNLHFSGVDLTIAISLTVTGTATFGSSHSNTGTITGNATWSDCSFANFSTGTVSGTKTFSCPVPVVFVTNYGNSWTYDSSSWNFTATPTWLFDGGGTNNAGTLNGDATFQNSSYNVCVLGSVTGTATYNGLTGPVSPYYYILGQCTNLDASGNGFWNGHAYYLGAQQPNGWNSIHYYVDDVETTLPSSGTGYDSNSTHYYVNGVETTLPSSGTGYDSNSTHYYVNGVETTLPSSGTGYDSNSTIYYIVGVATDLNSEGNGYWNSTYYYNGNVFEPTLQIFTGSVNGDWNNLGNWKPDASLPLLAGRLPLSTEDVELRASVTTNGGSQPTVTNLEFGTEGPGQTFNINLTVLGTATFYNDSINNGTITGNAIFNSTSSNSGTVSGNATFNETSSNGGTVSGNATWSGSAFTNFSLGTTVGGTKTFSNASSVVFTTNGSNNWTYNSSSWTFATPGPTWIFEGSSSNTGTLAGDATFNDSSNNNFIVSGNATFNGSSSNVGGMATVSGNATFNGSSNQLGTVTGTTTCNTSGTCP